MHAQTSLPQAESFVHVMDLLQYMRREPFSRREALAYFDIEPQKMNFYTGATIYLDLAEEYRDYDEDADEEDFYYGLTPFGCGIMEMDVPERNRSVVECMLQHQLFRHALNLYSKQLILLTQQQAAEIIRELHSDASEHVVKRCSATVLNWTDWILEQRRR